MSEQKQKPREWALTGFNLTVGDNKNPIADIRIATLLMPNTVMNGESIKVIEHSAYQALKEQADKLEKALENLKGHTEAHLQFPYKDTSDLTISIIEARQALAEYRKSKGEV